MSDCLDDSLHHLSSRVLHGTLPSQNSGDGSDMGKQPSVPSTWPLRLRLFARLIDHSVPSILLFLWNRGPNRDTPQQHDNPDQAINLIHSAHLAFSTPSSLLVPLYSLFASVFSTQTGPEISDYRESPVSGIQNFGAVRSVFLTSSAPAQLCSANMRCPALANTGILVMQAFSVSSAAPP